MTKGNLTVLWKETIDEVYVIIKAALLARTVQAHSRVFEKRDVTTTYYHVVIWNSLNQ